MQLNWQISLKKHVYSSLILLRLGVVFRMLDNKFQKNYFEMSRRDVTIIPK